QAHPQAGASSSQPRAGFPSVAYFEAYLEAPQASFEAQDKLPSSRLPRSSAQARQAGFHNGHFILRGLP
ncbi:MAG: hypothetical protein O7E52_21105, partial [Candidatus Poribacteria bacterium]|nr:hypothetical protein [Candidatus Poribacteria bacterium]